MRDSRLFCVLEIATGAAGSGTAFFFINRISAYRIGTDTNNGLGNWTHGDGSISFIVEYG